MLTQVTLRHSCLDVLLMIELVVGYVNFNFFCFLGSLDIAKG